MKTNNRGAPAGEEDMAVELTVEERVSILEKSLRRWRTISLVSLVLLIGVGGASGWILFGVPRALRARRIEIINDKGTSVVALEAGKLGGQITTRNDHGHSLFVVSTEEKLEATKGDALIEIYSAKGAPMVGFSTSPTGGWVQVFNNLGKEVVGLQSNKANCGSIMVKDVDGGLRESLSGSRARY